MKKLAVGTAILALLCSTTFAQSSPAASSGAPAPRPEVYHVTFLHAAAGKINALEDAIKKSSGSGSMPGHVLGLRHEAGSPWDFVAIEHEGAKATVAATGNPQGPSMRPLLDWHDDTFASGPAWADFAKAMGLDDSGKVKSHDDVFVVSVYRPVPGQDDALEKFLSEPPAASGDLAAGAVVLAHLEGGAWRFLTISRYKSYADYATSEAASVAQINKGSGPWYRLRELSSFHNDTIAVHAMP